MGWTISPLACFLLLLSLSAARTDSQTFNSTPSPSVSTVDTTVVTYKHTTDASTTVTVIAVTTVNTSQRSTLPPATTTLTGTTPETQSSPAPSPSAQTTQTIHTTGYVSTTDLSIATETPPHTSNTTAPGERLNVTEMTMTVVFGGVLVLFVGTVIVVVLRKYKHKIQYLHQPLSDTGDTGGFVAGEDTLVISGGLYDGHPIYDNVPPVPADQSQFRLQFFQ